MKIIHKILCIAALLTVGTVHAQQPEVDVAADTASIVEDSTIDSRAVVRLLVRSYGDSIVLRWAPSDAGLWMTATNYGWLLLRAGEDDNPADYYITSIGDTIPYVSITGNKPILPLSLDEMMQRFDSTNQYAGAAAQALYGQMQYNVNQSESTTGIDFLALAAKQYQEQTQRQFMAYLAAECDPQVAGALGLRFVDHNVKPGEFYEYMLISLIPTDLVDIAPATAITRNIPFARPVGERMPAVRVTQIDAYRAAVRWNKNRLSHYNIDRSNDGGQTWRRLNTAAPIWPMVPDSATALAYGDSVAAWMENEIVFIDSLSIDTSYIFRVEAIDAFGDHLKPRPSESFQMYDLIPPVQPFLKTILPEENRICAIEWIAPKEQPDLVGYAVTFSQSLQGPWGSVTSLLPPDTRSYIDSIANLRGRGYYRVFATDTAGNVSYSAPMLNHIEDIIPPSKPQGLVAISADTAGLVYIEWNKGFDKDLMAYKVYFANQRDHDFVELTPGYISDTFYLDTVDIAMLSREIFYYVVAVDDNHNYSTPSDTLRVLLPDIIAPGVAVLVSVHQEGDSVYIDWLKSVSDDAANYFIYRRPRPSPNWECIALVESQDVSPDDIIHFVDTPTPAKHPYSYCIEVRDSVGNSSGYAGYALIQVDEPRETSMDIRLKGSFNKKSKAPVLTWKYKYTGRKEYYGVVYRSVDGGAFTDIGTFKHGETSFTDSKAPSGAKCTYYIDLQLGQGRHSSPSNQVSVKTK